MLSTFGTSRIRDTVSDLITIPQPTNIKLTIEFDFEQFKYTTERFNTAMVDNKLTNDDIDVFFNEIYQLCNNFSFLKRINYFIRIAKLLIILMLILSIIIIIQLCQNDPSIGIMILYFCLFMLVMIQLIIITFGFKESKRAYVNKINTVISNHYQEYEAKGLRWKQCHSIGLELWMDYKIMGKVIFNTEMFENVALISIDQNEIKHMNKNKYIELIVGDSLIPFSKISDITKR